MPDISATDDLILAPAEMGTSRWHYERERLRLFPAFALLGTSGQITAAEGALDTQSGNTYGIRIVLDNYPYALPTVFSKGWTIHPAVTHKYSDKSLCIMRSDQWRRHFTVALVITKTAIMARQVRALEAEWATSGLGSDKGTRAHAALRPDRTSSLA